MTLRLVTSAPPEAGWRVQEQQAVTWRAYSASADAPAAAAAAACPGWLPCALARLTSCRHQGVRAGLDNSERPMCHHADIAPAKENAGQLVAEAHAGSWTARSPSGGPLQACLQQAQASSCWAREAATLGPEALCAEWLGSFVPPAICKCPTADFWQCSMM